MGIIRLLFTDKNVRKYYKNNDDLNRILHEFETYVFYVYEKVSIVAEIKNKAYDIAYRNKGFIKEDEQRFDKKKFEADRYKKDKLEYYFRGWTDKRLKRIMKIISLELKSPEGVRVEQANIIECISEMKNCFDSKDATEADSTLRKIVNMLHKLEDNLAQQKQELDKLYPLRLRWKKGEWSYEQHRQLFPEGFLRLLQEELQLIFGTRVTQDYNCYPALVSKAIHEQSLPEESTLRRMIETNIKKIKQNKNLTSRYITCYHAKPITVHGGIFPLSPQEKSTGFFVDTDMKETIQVVSRIYGVGQNEVIIYELQIPENIFRYAIPDTLSGYKIEVDHSYVFRPTAFPKLNEFYEKGIIKLRIV
ncbi:MAG: hypothetical protein ABIF10_03645 [Candidatus Woesearchaeota archaeon]